jgi:hypothetical protein
MTSGRFAKTLQSPVKTTCLASLFHKRNLLQNGLFTSAIFILKLNEHFIMAYRSDQVISLCSYIYFKCIPEKFMSKCAECFTKLTKN